MKTAKPRQPRGITEEQRATLATLSTSEAAAKLGLSIACISTWRRKFGIPAPYQQQVPNRYPTPPRDELASLVDQMAQGRVAAHYGVSIPVVRRWCKEHGIEAKPASYYLHLRNEEAKQESLPSPSPEPKLKEPTHTPFGPRLVIIPQRHELAALLETHTIEQLAAKFQCGPDQINKWKRDWMLYDAGPWKPRFAPIRPKEDRPTDKQLFALLDTMALSDVAKLYKVEREVVKAWLIEAGVQV